jgi:hypothetical protein
MGIYVCPAAVVAAPCAKVWEVLTNLPADARWIDAEVERVEPPGTLQGGQTIRLSASGLGRQWPVTMYIDEVDAARLMIAMRVALPLGIVNRERISCAPISTSACRVQFG